MAVKKVVKTMEDVFKNSSHYSGKHVIVAGGKVFTAKTGERASEILENVREKFPKDIPEVTYIPKADTLILVCLQ